MTKTLSSEEYQSMHKKTIGNFNINSVHYSSLSKMPVKNKKVLDIGCGNGELLFLLKQQGACIYGLDFEEKSIQKAREVTQEYKNIEIQNATKLPYKNEFFDLIYCIGTIGYLSEPDKKILLKEMYRVLKPDGTVIIRTSTKINKIGTFLLKLRDKKYQSNTNFYTFKNYKKNIEDSGLHISSWYRSMDLAKNQKRTFFKILLYKLLSYFFSSTWILLKK